jgi:hypothetical protein
MKKFFLYTFLVLFVLAGLFVYLLYTEGAFDSVPKSEMKPFSATGMKCGAGKCGAGKCGESMGEGK